MVELKFNLPEINSKKIAKSIYKQDIKLEKEFQSDNDLERCFLK